MAQRAGYEGAEADNQVHRRHNHHRDLEGRQHANIMPPLSQEHNGPTRGLNKPITARIQIVNYKQDLGLGE